MKAFSLIKVLTVVSMILFTQVGWGVEDEADVCEKKCGPALVGGKLDDNNLVTQIKTREECLSRCEKAGTKCDAAYAKYTEAAEKGNDACDAFDKTSDSDTCIKRVDACRQQINQATEPYDSSSSSDSGLAGLESFAMQSLGLNSKGSNGSGECVRPIDSTTARQQKKDKDRERRDLQDKISQQKKDLIKDKEDFDKESAAIDKEKNEIEADFKKSLRDKDKKMREDMSKATKDEIDVGKRLRDATTSISQKQQQLATVNFDYQTSMLELTDEKINQKCKQEFESLKAGIVNSKLGGAPASGSAEDKKNYEALAALAAQYKSKGIRGTGELKTMLLATRKACFEGANTRRNKNKMVNAQAVENIQRGIETDKQNIQDIKNTLAENKKNLQQIKVETDTEKTQEEEDKVNKLTVLNKKMTNLLSSFQAKNQAFNEKKQELDAEIKNVMVVDMFEVKTSFGDANKAIFKTRSTLAAAYNSCKCEDKANSKNQICSTLSTGSENMTGDKIPAIKPASKR